MARISNRAAQTPALRPNGLAVTWSAQKVGKKYLSSLRVQRGFVSFEVQPELRMRSLLHIFYSPAGNEYTGAGKIPFTSDKPGDTLVMLGRWR